MSDDLDIGTDDGMLEALHHLVKKALQKYGWLMTGPVSRG